MTEPNLKTYVCDEMRSVIADAFEPVGRLTPPSGDPIECARALVKELHRLSTELAQIRTRPEEPIPMRLTCPICHELHIDEGEQATKPHRTHACQNCGHLWSPAVVPTVGVRFLPGCKNETSSPMTEPGCTGGEKCPVHGPHDSHEV